MQLLEVLWSASEAPDRSGPIPISSRNTTTPRVGYSWQKPRDTKLYHVGTKLISPLYPTVYVGWLTAHHVHGRDRVLVSHSLPFYIVWLSGYKATVSPIPHRVVLV